MCAHMPRLLFTMLVGGVIAVWATHPLSLIGQSRGDTDEDRLLLGTWKLNVAKIQNRYAAAKSDTGL
jgi:hypothetical protein